MRASTIPRPGHARRSFEGIQAERFRMRVPGNGSDDVLRLRLPAAPESVPEIRHALAEYVREAGADDAFRIAVAVGEAVGEVVTRAAPEGDRGALEVEATVDGAEVQVTVRDCTGLPPSDPRRGLGLGLPLMVELADRLTFRRVGGRETEVRLSFSLARPRERTERTAR